MSTPEVHPTALVDPRAMLDAGVRVGAFTIVGPDVSLGPGVELGHHVGELLAQARQLRSVLLADGDLRQFALRGEIRQAMAEDDATYHRGRAAVQR